MQSITPIQLFKALSELTRLRCVSLLLQEGELCVCELTHALALPQPKISHHLGNLRKSGLVTDRKSGLWIYYQLNPELPLWVIDMLKTMIEGIKTEAPFSHDMLTLSSMSNRPENLCSACS